MGMVRDVLDQDGIPEISMSSDSGSDEDADDIDPQLYRSFTPDMGLAHFLSEDPQLLSDDTVPDSEEYVHHHIAETALSHAPSHCRILSPSNPTVASTSSTIASADDQSPQSTAHSLNRNPSPSPSHEKA